MQKQAKAYPVPVLFPSAHDDRCETVLVELRKLPDFKTRRETDMPYRLTVVEGTVFAVRFNPALGIGSQDTSLNLLELYTNNLSLSYDGRELESNADTGESIPVFKVSAAMTRKVLKAVHMLGYMTRAQYQAAEAQRIKAASAEFEEARLVRAEDELSVLLTEMPLARAKKLIDYRIKQDKQARKDAALASEAHTKEVFGNTQTVAGSTIG
jgi:hypothetical protein